MPSASDPLTVRAPLGHLLRGQLQHALLLALLLPGAWALAAPSLDDGSWLGVADRTWFAVALAVPVVQQVLVVVVWRLELCVRGMTGVFGDAGFVVWGVMFFPLLVARPLAVLAVGLADRGSLDVPQAVGVGLGLLLLAPALWVLHSVVTYFGFARALGGDHFFERYRRMPLVREGAFAVTSNAMYGIAFLVLWAIALLCGSRAALVAALFQHAYIWVHWYCTEAPDAEVLHGDAA